MRQRPYREANKMDYEIIQKMDRKIAEIKRYAFKKGYVTCEDWRDA